jgi:hypothetical protein
MMRVIDSPWTRIALTKTMSAHAISGDRSGCTFMSTSRRRHDAGSMAPTVNSPSGGKTDRRFSNPSACRKLQ